jgi:hypothetical protein
MPAPHVIYSDGDPYVFDPDSGEWIELHHNQPDHHGTHA